MSFEDLKNNNPNPFLQPFDKEKIFDQLDKIDHESGGDGYISIYEEKISDSIDFKVESQGLFLFFFIIDKDDNTLANFIFKVDDDKITLQHRVINKRLKDLSITGSAVLKKTEEFIKLVLEKSNNKEVKKFVIDSGQTGITNWAIKNGYQFENDEQKDRYHRIISGQEKDYFVSDDFKFGDMYSGYIFSKENYDRAKIFLAEKKAQGEEGFTDFRDFSERFELVKEIK